MGGYRRNGHNDVKVSVKLSPVELGMIEYLVANSYFINRSSWIRDAIGRELQRRDKRVTEMLDRDGLVVGKRSYDGASLEEVRRDGTTERVRLVGLLEVADDVTAELAAAVLTPVTVFGAVRASPAIRALVEEGTARFASKLRA